MQLNFINWIAVIGIAITGEFILLSKGHHLLGWLNHALHEQARETRKG